MCFYRNYLVSSYVLFPAAGLSSDSVSGQFVLALCSIVSSDFGITLGQQSSHRVRHGQAVKVCQSFGHVDLVKTNTIEVDNFDVRFPILSCQPVCCRAKSRDESCPGCACVRRFVPLRVAKFLRSGTRPGCMRSM